MNHLLALTRDTLIFLGGVVVAAAIITRGIDGMIAIGFMALLVLIFGGIAKSIIRFLGGLLNYAR